MNSEAEAYLTVMVYLWLGAFILFCFCGIYAWFWLRGLSKELVNFMKLMMTLYEYERDKKERPD